MSIVVFVVIVFVVYGRTAAGRKVLVARCSAAMSVDFAFVVMRRQQIDVHGGGASAVGLNHLCQAISGVDKVVVNECRTSVPILRHPVPEKSKGQLASRRTNGREELLSCTWRHTVASSDRSSGRYLKNKLTEKLE